MLAGTNKAQTVAMTERLPTTMVVGEIMVLYAHGVSRLWHIISSPLFMQQCREDERVWRGGCLQAPP
jgi:hypothetical protein